MSKSEAPLPSDVDAILVLGSKVRYPSREDYERLRELPFPFNDYRGKVPGPVLRSRLEYVETRRTLPIVVSGRGEATPMAWWLFCRGVDPRLIVCEYHATSTNENLEYAVRLLPKVRRWLVVTSDFHVLRTRLWAWHLGISVVVVGRPTPTPYRHPALVREGFALLHSLTRIGWRRLCALGNAGGTSGSNSR